MLGGRDGKGQKGDSKKEFNKSFGNNSTSGEASQVAVVVKNPPVSAGDQGLIPGWARSPGEGDYNSNIFAWEIPWTEEPGRLQSLEVAKSWT